MNKALTTALAALAAGLLSGCLGGGMVVDDTVAPDTETDTDGTEAMPLSGNDPAGPLTEDRRDRIAAAKMVPVREFAPVIQTR